MSRSLDITPPEDSDIYTVSTIFNYLPLRLCYAISVHRSQGAMLDLVEVDCKRMFCHDQCYVALSRCTSTQGLIVKNFSQASIICDPSVRTFCDL
jgi:ATP-dependent DNA helicase PIF1